MLTSSLLRFKQKTIAHTTFALMIVLGLVYTVIYQRHSFEVVRSAFPTLPHTFHYEFTIAWNRIRSYTEINQDEAVESPLWRVPVEEVNERAIKGGLLDYLPEYKCPCWYDSSISESGLRCLPYFYLAGVAKSGTTALHDQLVKHPDIESPEVKEPFYWTYPTRRNLNGYLNIFQNARTQIYRESVNGYHSKITFEGTTNYLTDNGVVDKYKNNMENGEPRFTLPHTLYALNPKTKIIVSMRNPTERLLSDYHFHSFITVIGIGKEYSMENFHKLVVDAVAKFQACLAQRSVRSCIYDSDLIESASKGGQLKLGYGMYYPYIKEWLSVFPSNQMLFIKAEELYASASSTLKDAFHFLNLTAPVAVLDAIDNEMSMKYQHEKTADHSGKSYRNKMWPETKKILDEFYGPFNEQLAELLKDDKWLFNH